MASGQCLISVGNTGTSTTPFLGAPRIGFLRPRFDSKGNQNTIGIAMTGGYFPGTITLTAGGNVAGVGTTFTKSFNLGDTFQTGNSISIVTSITSDTVMTVSDITSTAAALSVYNTFCKNYLLGLITQPDPTKRLYPLPPAKNGKDERKNSIMNTFEDNTKEKVQQDVREFEYLITRENQGAIPVLKMQLDPIWKYGLPMDMYYVDIYGNFVGAQNTFGQLDGRKIDSGSLDNIYNPGQNKKGNDLNIMLNFAYEEIDENMACLEPCDMDTTIANKMGLLMGLQDINPGNNQPIYSSLSHTGPSSFVISLPTLYNTQTKPNKATGLTLKNFQSKTTVPVQSNIITSATGFLPGDIIVGNISNAVGQFVQYTTGSTVIDIAILSGTFTTADVACKIFRNGIDITHGSGSGVISAAVTLAGSSFTVQSYNATLTGVVYDGSIGSGIYVALSSVVETLSGIGRPTGVYTVTTLTAASLTQGTNMPHTGSADSLQPYLQNIIGNGFSYYDFTNINTNPQLV